MECMDIHMHMRFVKRQYCLVEQNCIQIWPELKKTSNYELSLGKSGMEIFHCEKQDSCHHWHIKNTLIQKDVRNPICRRIRWISGAKKVVIATGCLIITW